MTTQAEQAPRQVGPQVWHGRQIEDPSIWTWNLSGAEIGELLVASVPYRDRPWDALAGISRENFDLPLLHGRLAGLRQRLTRGRGFELITGFPADDCSDMQCARR